MGLALCEKLYSMALRGHTQGQMNNCHRKGYSLLRIAATRGTGPALAQMLVAGTAKACRFMVRQKALWRGQTVTVWRMEIGRLLISVSVVFP